MTTKVVCCICETIQPVNPRGLIRPHESDDSGFYCDGSLKPKNWGLPIDDLPLATDIVGPL